MFCPEVMSSAAPRAMACMARVAMKGGVLKRVIMRALIKLQKTATPIATAIATAIEPVTL